MSELPGAVLRPDSAPATAGENAAAQWLNLKIAAAILLAIAAFGVYFTALRNGFAYDDVLVVPQDVRVTEFQFRNMLTKPYWAAPGMGLYRPLVTFSFAVDWALSDGSAAWFHAVNAAWHAAVTVAVFALLLTWFTVPAAGLGALIFAVHPVHVEAVANVVGRAELMAAFFVLLACIAWTWDRPSHNTIRSAVVCALFALAMLCKESAAVLPALLVMIDAAQKRWNGVRDLPEYLVRCWRFYAALTAVLIGAVALRIAVTGVASPTQVDPIIEILQSPVDRVRTSMQVWPQYLRLLFFPRVLLADYGPRVMMPLDPGDPLILIGATILASTLLGGLYALSRGRPLAALAIWWLPITVLPVANLIVPIGILLAERTLYLPSVAVSLLVALLATAAAHAPLQHRRPLQVGLGALLVAAVSLGAWRTHTRIPDWRTTDTILMAQLRDRPDSFRGYWHAARIERRRNNVDNALEHYGYALYLWPYREQLLVDAATYAATNGRTGLALRWSSFGAERLPNSLRLQTLAAANALDAGDTAVAASAIEKALRIAPTDSLILRMQAAMDSARER